MSNGTMGYKEYTAAALIDKLVEQDKLMKDLKADTDGIKAELQTRGLELLEDRNIKNTEWYGTNNSNVAITKAQTMEIMNYPALETALGKELLEDKVTRKVEVKYDVESSFKQALIGIFCDDYVKDMKLEDMLKKEFPELETKQINLLLKKLKGDYKKDKELLKTMVNRDDLDVELYFIYKIKNYEKIKAYIPDEKSKEVIEAVKRYIIVDDTAKITLKYDKDSQKQQA